MRFSLFLSMHYCWITAVVINKWTICNKFMHLVKSLIKSNLAPVIFSVICYKDLMHRKAWKTKNTKVKKGQSHGIQIILLQSWHFGSHSISRMSYACPHGASKIQLFLSLFRYTASQCVLTPDQPSTDPLLDQFKESRKFTWSCSTDWRHNYQLLIIWGMI